jgi:hypothetical protein
MPQMTQVPSPRVRLIAPLVHLAALLLLVEQWTWNLGLRIAGNIARWPPLTAIEIRVRKLPPYPALCAFVLPGFLLLPVKVLALVAIAHGHPISGITTFVVAKLGGAVVVGRLYRLTLPSLLSLAWFACLHHRFVVLKDHWIGLLRDSHVFRRAGRLATKLLRVTRRLVRHLQPSTPFTSPHPSRTVRLLRRFAALWRARHR